MFLAKSFLEETIRSHTDRLLYNYWLIKKNYGPTYIHMDERLWELLKWAVLYHDMGKANAAFQNKLRKKVGKPEFETDCTFEVPHNYLSTVLIPYKKLGIEGDERKLLAQAVGYHHERDRMPDQDLKQDLKEVVKQDLIGKLDLLSEHMNIPLIERPVFSPYDLLQKRFRWGLNEEERTLFLRYVMLKGLLHRLDHAASAYVDVEQCTNSYIGNHVNIFLRDVLKTEKRELQTFAEQNKDKHVVIVAQTGMGKTEAGLLWIDKEKGFFTLPIRVSINAMYDRIRDPLGINFSAESGALGILHSSSLDYLDLQNDETVDYEAMHQHSQQLANKLLITTIDQILKFPFFYRGFEKEYCALAGAKIVIDELQAYDPKIAALIVRALEMIDAIGGKFMIMTATLPKIYFDRIMNSKEIQRFPLVYKTFVNDDLKRHRLKMINTSILDYIKEIALAGKQKKTLVICNTVKQAINVYERLLQEKADVNLLHSLFLQKDRFLLEKKIKEFAKNCSYGIWVTTQLVEASLDIDFDILYTELSTLDSFFQRLGRCYRQRNLEHNKPNIWVFTEDISGVPYVYDKDLVYKSVILLQNYNEKLLLESEKIKLIEVLYSNESLRGMNFFKTFNETLSYLENIEPYDIDKQEAQKYLRDINNVKVIPRNVFDQISDDLIARYRKEKDRVKRRRLRREIDQYTISINKYRARNFLSKSGLPASLADLFIMDLYYDFYKGRGVGLNLSKSEGLENFMS